MIVVVDYGVGNLRSVMNAFLATGADVRVSGAARDVRDAERIVLPGVGAFADCMRSLERTGLVEVLDQEVRGKGKPFLGICVGMQLLAKEGVENGQHAGLGWLAAHVVRFTVEDKGLKVPHVGWNEVMAARQPSVLLAGLGERPTFYFVHSYYVVCDDRAAPSAMACAAPIPAPRARRSSAPRGRR